MQADNALRGRGCLGLTDCKEGKRERGELGKIDKNEEEKGGTQGSTIKARRRMANEDKTCRITLETLR